MLERYHLMWNNIFSSNCSDHFIRVKNWMNWFVCWSWMIRFNNSSWWKWWKLTVIRFCLQAQEVQTVFPSIDLRSIIEDLQNTHSVEITINNILEGRLTILVRLSKQFLIAFLPLIYIYLLRLRDGLWKVLFSRNYLPGTYISRVVLSWYKLSEREDNFVTMLFYTKGIEPLPMPCLYQRSLRSCSNRFQCSCSCSNIKREQWIYN